MTFVFSSQRWVAATLIVVAVASLGCGVRARRRAAEPTGFLGDYSRLEKVAGYDFLEMYIEPDVQWSKYRAIHLDSVTLWASSVQGKLSTRISKC